MRTVSMIVTRLTSRGRGRLGRPVPVAGALVGSCLLLAACGGGAPGAGVAHLQAVPTHAASGSHADTAHMRASLLAFARCMQTHGVPAFPDPVTNASGQQTLQINGGPNSGLNPNSPAWQAAQTACKSLIPAGLAPSPAQQRTMEAQALKFSACMRAHGEPNFPDPSFGAGAVKLSISVSSGIDPRSPLFQTAQTDCRSLLPFHGHHGGGGGGAITVGG